VDEIHRPADRRHALGAGAPIGEIAELFGKAKVQGTLFAEDINQLVGRGIPVIQEFAKQLGVSEGEVKKLASSGKITFSNLNQAFIDLSSEGGAFFNMMQEQSQTTIGKFSTLKDNILAAALPIGEAWNALDEAADKIEELERERLCICDVCDALQDSPLSFLAQMKTWAAKVRTANK
jgi:tape measure domain-containing protein